MVAVVLAGCSGGQESSTRDRPASAAPEAEPAAAEPAVRPPEAGNTAPSCEQRADEMGRLMTAAADQPPMIMSSGPGMPVLPETRAGEVVRVPGYVLTIDARGGLELDGDRITRREEIKAYLERPRHSRVERKVVYLWADREVRVAAVVDAMAGLPPALERRLVVLDPTPPPQPAVRLLKSAGVKKLQADLRPGAVNPSERAAVLAKALQGAVAPCAPMVRAFGDVVGEEDKGGFLAREVPAALRACNCAMVDVDVVEYGVLAMFGVYDRWPRALPLPAEAELRKHGQRTVGELVAVLAGR